MNAPALRPGRPKSLDRAHVINVAMAQYWAQGPTDVPISEICANSGASKPALYREFGNDDGLRVAVLEQYRSTFLEEGYKVLRQDKHFNDIVEEMLALLLPQEGNDEVPLGCLVFFMRCRKGRLGELTSAKLEQLQREQFDAYRQWIETCQANGSVRKEIPPKTAATFCNMQFTGAMQLHREGVSNADIADGLRTAFATLAVLQ